MSEDGEKTDGGKKEWKELVRFDRQIARAHSIVKEWGDAVRVYRAPFVDDEGRQAFMRRAGMGPRKGGRASIVPADECAVELGAPGKANVNIVLWTTDPKIVNDGEIRLLGPDIAVKEKVSWPYAQLVIVALDDYQSLKEAAYLLRSPENARRLLAAIDRLEHGGGTTRELLDPAGE